jgi:RNA 2',3'-cyclic 3'-phosphodiesterase
MNKIRAFIAVEIDSASKPMIFGLINLLKETKADVKWITENQTHLTLKFLGYIDQSGVRDISDGLKSVLRGFRGFNITLSGIGAFPDIRHPRVVWIGITKGADLLKLLNDKIETALEKLDFEKEKRDFKAHLTIGRVRSFKNIPDLIKAMNTTDFKPENEIKINKLVLFQSTLTPKGANYTSLAEIRITY